MNNLYCDAYRRYACPIKTPPSWDVTLILYTLALEHMCTSWRCWGSSYRSFFLHCFLSKSSVFSLILPLRSESIISDNEQLAEKGRIREHWHPLPMTFWHNRLWVHDTPTQLSLALPVNSVDIISDRLQNATCGNFGWILTLAWTPWTPWVV
jgi:hypothetical protein